MGVVVFASIWRPIRLLYCTGTKKLAIARCSVCMYSYSTDVLEEDTTPSVLSTVSVLSHAVRTVPWRAKPHKSVPTCKEPTASTSPHSRRNLVTYPHLPPSRGCPLSVAQCDERDGRTLQISAAASQERKDVLYYGVVNLTRARCYRPDLDSGFRPS